MTLNKEAPRNNRLKDISIFYHVFLICAAPIVTIYFAVIIKLYASPNWMIDPEFENSYLVIIPLLLLTLFLAVIFAFLFFVYKYMPSNRQFYIAYYSCFTFFYLRLFLTNESDWHFIQIFKTSVTFADIPFGLLSIFVISTIIRKIDPKKPVTTNNIILEDTPLYESKDYEIFASLIEKIGPALFQDNYKYALSIAIIGPWGCGKSSFLKAVEHKVNEHKRTVKRTKRQDLIFVSFSPFLNHGKEDVTYEFFIQLSNILKTYHGNLSADLVIYAKKLSSLNSEFSIDNILKIAESNNNKRSVEELYQSINKAISELNKKIIVAVDDVDRLNGTEIIEVLKMIRNSSNFSNTVFLVAMDKKHVLESIQQTKTVNENYLDKFFQLELHLDFITGHSISEAVKFYVSQVTKALNFSKNKSTEIIDSFWRNTILIDFIKSHRDAKRLINQFFVDYQCVNYDINVSEIEIKDLILLTILKQKNYELLMILKDENNLFLQYDIGHELLIIPPTTVFSDHYLPPETISYYTNPEDFGSIIKDHNITIGGKQYSKELGVLLINLFGVKDTSVTELSKTSPLSIKNPSKLNLYFERALPESEISNSEYNKILELEESKIREKLSADNFKTHRLSSFRKHLQSNVDNDPDNFERFINLFLIINSIQPLYNDATEICKLLEKTFSVHGQDKFNSEVSKLINYDKSLSILQIEILIRLIDESQIKEFNLTLDSNVDSSLINLLIEYKTEINGIQKLKKLHKLLFSASNTEEIAKLIVSDFKSKISQIDLSELINFAVQTDQNSYKLNKLILQIYPSLLTLIEDLYIFKNSTQISLIDVKELLMLFEISNNSKDFHIAFESTFLKKSRTSPKTQRQIIYQINDKQLFDKLNTEKSFTELLNTKTIRFNYFIHRDNSYFLRMNLEINSIDRIYEIIEAITEVTKDLYPNQKGVVYRSGISTGTALTINDTEYVKTISIQPKISPKI